MEVPNVRVAYWLKMNDAFQKKKFTNSVPMETMKKVKLERKDSASAMDITGQETTRQARAHSPRPSAARES